MYLPHEGGGGGTPLFQARKEGGQAQISRTYHLNPQQKKKRSPPAMRGGESPSVASLEKKRRAIRLVCAGRGRHSHYVLNGKVMI